MAKDKRSSAPFFLVALAVVLLDQASKLLVRANLELGESFPATGPFRFTYVTNTGASFGILQGQALPLLVTALIAILALALFWRRLAGENALLRIGLGMQLGGAAGNVVDRLRYGYVVDFLDFRVWPVFNLADSAIVVGIGVLAFFVLFQPKRKQA